MSETTYPKAIQCPKCGKFRIWRAHLPIAVRMSIQKGATFIMPDPREGRKIVVRDADTYLYFCEDCEHQWEVDNE